ncbi:MAG: hypothetical protein J6T26_04035 [Firmicutes bacterium]|nr:hypothetical protein [Bacillota bacterium]
MTRLDKYRQINEELIIDHIIDTSVRAAEWCFATRCTEGAGSMDDCRACVRRWLHEELEDADEL